MSSREFGYKLEHYVADLFRGIGYKSARPSKGSGNRGEAGDIAGQDMFVTECKNRSTKNATIISTVWAKLNGEIPLHSKRKPLLILGNEKQTIYAVLEAEDFFTILKGYIANEESKVT